MPQNVSLKLFSCRLAEQVEAALTRNAANVSNLSEEEEAVASEMSYFGGFMMAKVLEQASVFPYFVWETSFKKINVDFVNGLNRNGLYDVMLPYLLFSPSLL